MKKIFNLIIFNLVVSLLCSNIVFASEYEGTFKRVDVIPNVYYYKLRKDPPGYSYPAVVYKNMAIIYRDSINNDVVYCIKSWAESSEKSEIGDYQVYDHNVSKTNLTDETLELLNLIAYFGYEYQDETHDHTDPVWYALTQVLIWRHQAPDYEHYITKSHGSNVPLYEYDSWMDEIMELVNNYLAMPNINNSVTMKNNSKVILNDDNNVLNNFKIVNETDLNIYSSDANLFIESSLNTGNYQIKLVKEDTHENMKVYVSDDYQNFITPGKRVSLEKEIDVSVTSPKLKFSYLDYIYESVDYQNNEKKKEPYFIPEGKFRIIVNEDILTPSGEILYKKGFTYYEFETGNEVVEIDMIDGSFLLEQINDVEGYDKVSSEIIINNDMELTLIPKKKLAKINLIKEKECIDKFGNIKSEIGENIQFGLYANEDIYTVTNKLFAKKDSLIWVFSTDTEGKINEKIDFIPEGKYYFKELTVLNNYQNNNILYNYDFFYKSENNPEESEKPIVVLNKLKRANIYISAFDKYNNVIDGLTYKIYNHYNNLIFSGITTLYDIPITLTLGKYKIEIDESNTYKIENKINNLFLENELENYNLKIMGEVIEEKEEVKEEIKDIDETELPNKEDDQEIQEEINDNKEDLIEEEIKEPDASENQEVIEIEVPITELNSNGCLIIILMMLFLAVMIECLKD